MLLPKQSESLFSCLQGELLTFLLLQNGPIHSTVNTNICWYIQYSYHFRFVIFADIGCVLSDSIFVHFYEDETTILKIQCGPSLSSFSIHTLFCFGWYIYPFLGSKKGMYRSKQKRICIGQDVIDGPHCTFLTLFGTGEYFYPLTLLNSICFHQNFSIFLSESG